MIFIMPLVIEDESVGGQGKKGEDLDPPRGE